MKQVVRAKVGCMIKRLSSVSGLSMETTPNRSPSKPVIIVPTPHDAAQPASQEVIGCDGNALVIPSARTVR